MLIKNADCNIRMQQQKVTIGFFISQLC